MKKKKYRNSSLGPKFITSKKTKQNKTKTTNKIIKFFYFNRNNYFI